ncbi:MAG: hypothetical protein ACK55I_42000, partial [bacterium]
MDPRTEQPPAPHLTMDPLSQSDIPDPEVDRVFMGEALRQAVKAYDAQEVPVGAVIVRGHRVI